MKLWKKITLGFLAFILAATVFAVMAARRSHSGVMARVGIHGPEDIQAVGFEYGHSFLDPYHPIYWITDRKKIARVYAALMDRNTIIRDDYQMALVGSGGQVVLFNTKSQSQMGPGEPEDNWKESLPNPRLLVASELFRAEEPDTSVIPTAQPARIRYYTPGSGETPVIDMATASDPRAPRLRAMVNKLLWQFNPSAVSGLRSEEAFSVKDRICLEIKFSEPVSFRAIIYPKEFSLSYTPCTEAKFETVVSDRVFIIRVAGSYEDRVSTSFVFKSAKEAGFFGTRPRPRREIKGYDKDGNPIMGKDLFDELVKELEKPAK